MSGALVVVALRAAGGDLTALTTGLTAALGLYLLSAMRYLLVRRSDTTSQQAFAVFVHAPLASIWTITFLRVLRLHAMATCFRTGWGTRQQVEGLDRPRRAHVVGLG